MIQSTQSTNLEKIYEDMRSEGVYDFIIQNTLNHIQKKQLTDEEAECEIKYQTRLFKNRMTEKLNIMLNFDIKWYKDNGLIVTDLKRLSSSKILEYIYYSLDYDKMKILPLDDSLFKLIGAKKIHNNNNIYDYDLDTVNIDWVVSLCNNIHNLSNVA
jgi:hypothetical protein